MRLRRFPLALLALLLTGALIAGCGGDDGSSNSSGSSGGGGGDTQDAGALLKDAFNSSNEVKSGELKLTASAEIEGDDDVKGPLKLTVSGPFATRGVKQLPLVDWDIEASGMGQSYSGNITATEDNAFVGFRGQTYEVGAMLYKQFLDQVAKQADSAPQSIGDLGLKPETWLEDPKVADGPSIGGDSTQQVSGAIDADAMVRNLADVLKSDTVQKAFRNQGTPVPEVSDSDIKKVVSALVNPKLEAAVDDEKRLRRLVFSTGLKRPAGETSGATGGKVDFAFELTKVGGTPDIKAPSGAKPIQLLFQQLGGAMGGRSGGLLTN